MVDRRFFSPSMNAPPAARQIDRYAGAITLLWAILFLAEVALSIYFCDGHLIYSLDDPYIHLALADQITHGGFGINPGEAASPSSSILWPWVMAGAQRIGLGAFAPILLDTAATAAALYVGAGLMRTIGFVQPERAPLFAGAMGVVLILTSNSLGLPMTGMEHSWHVLFVVLTLQGLNAAVNGRPPSIFCIAAIVLMPLIRFEGMAFAAAAVVALWFLGYRRAAAIAGGAIAAAVGLYVAFMRHQGLPLFPSSVMLKSEVSQSVYQGSGVLISVLVSVIQNIFTATGPILLLSAAISAWAAWANRRNPRRLALYLPAGMAIVAHLFLGKHGWLYRYEIYIMTLSLFILMIAACDEAVWRADTALARYGIPFLIAGALFSACEIRAVWVTPSAARNIYDQQYQMSRFAQDYYNRPVAVNDLGLVSYRSKHYVLDLFGLGSEVVRKLKLSGRYGRDSIDRLATRSHVDLIMVYEPWFKDRLPLDWRRIAVLHTGKPVSVAYGDVSFYITPAADAKDTLSLLRRFQSTLPKRDRLEILPVDGG
jgi:hypothetical protein